jgi:pyruvate/2-oxoglutarate dehydrogenase complex dihydrolipoamide acyltransferase (E2) component
MMFTWIHILSALTDRVANDGGMRLMAFVGDRMLKSAAMLNDKDVRILATAMASVTSAVDRFEGRRRRSINGRRDMEDCETAGWNARKQSYYILLRLTARRAGATSFPPELESIIFGYWYQDWFVEDVWTCNACTFINPSTSVPKCAVCDTPMTGPVSLTAAAAAAASTSVGIDGLTFSSRSAPFPRPVTAVRQAETLDRLMQEHARRSEMEMMLRLERQALQRKLEQDVVRNGIQQFMRYVTAVRPAAASASAAAAASSAASSSSATAAAAVSAAAPPITQPPQPPNPPQLPNPADNNDANNGCLTQ